MGKREMAVLRQSGWVVPPRYPWIPVYTGMTGGLFCKKEALDSYDLTTVTQRSPLERMVSNIDHARPDDRIAGSGRIEQSIQSSPPYPAESRPRQ